MAVDPSANDPRDTTVWPSPIPFPTTSEVSRTLPPPSINISRPQQVAGPPGAAARPQGYIGTGDQPAFRGRSMNELGRPDAIMSGMAGYPEGSWPDSPFLPQPRDMGRIIHGLVTGMGPIASPGIANPLLQAGLGMQGITKDYMAGASAMMNLRRQQMDLHLKEAADNYETQARDYKEIWDLYGPTVDPITGKITKKSDPQALHDALLAAAKQHHDRSLQTALEQGGLGKAEEYLRKIDGYGMDLKKLNAMLAAKEKLARIKKLEDENEANRKAEAPFRSPSSADPSRGPAYRPDTVVPMPPDIKSDKDTIPEDDPPDETTKPDDSSDTDIGDRSEAAPSEEPATEVTPSVAAAPSAVPAAQERPQQLAQVEPPAPSPGAGPSPPPSFAGIQPLPTSAEGRSLVMQASDASGAPPVPSKSVIVRDPSGVSIGPAGSKFVDSIKGYKPLPSDALAAAHAAGFINDSLINQYAQASVNREITIQDARNIPKAIRPYINARAMEMAREYDRIQQSNLSGDDVYKAIDLFNPKFSGILRKYVTGDVPPPASAWQNPTYRDRVVGLGSKVDPGFTYHTFRTKSAALRDIAVGQSGRNHLALATAYSHGKALLEDLKHRPDFLPSLLGNVRGVADLVATPQEQEMLGRLENDVNTFNAEYERALTQGKPTVTGRGEQSKEIPIVTGNTRTMVANIFSKLQRLRDREEELEKQFQASTGQQPGTMLKFLNQGTAGELDALKEMQQDMLPQPKPVDPATPNSRVLDGKRYERR